jgi:transcriptional regulator with XRE-family HTH domain
VGGEKIQYAEVYKMIGKRITQARIESGLEQSELAGLLGYTQPSVSRWENDKAECPASVLKKIADITGKSLHWFFEKETSDKSGSLLKKDFSKNKLSIMTSPGEQEFPLDKIERMLTGIEELLERMLEITEKQLQESEKQTILLEDLRQK